jgi:hypothetical protein
LDDTYGTCTSHAQKISGNLVVAAPNLPFGSRRNGSEGFAKHCFALTSGQSRMQAAWQMNGDVSNCVNLCITTSIAISPRTKKMSGNLVVAGQTALGGEIAKDYSSTIHY